MEHDDAEFQKAWGGLLKRLQGRAVVIADSG